MIAIVGLALMGPVATSVAFAQWFLSPDTRTAALRWIESNVPAGSSIVREAFTPQVPADRYRASQIFQLTRKSLDDYRALGVDYLVASSYQFDRFGGYPEIAAMYDDILALPIVLDIRPMPGLAGPRIVIVRLDGSTAP